MQISMFYFPSRSSSSPMSIRVSFSPPCQRIWILHSPIWKTWKRRECNRTGQGFHAMQFRSPISKRPAMTTRPGSSKASGLISPVRWADYSVVSCQWSCFWLSHTYTVGLFSPGAMKTCSSHNTHTKICPQWCVEGGRMPFPLSWKVMIDITSPWSARLFGERERSCQSQYRKQRDNSGLEKFALPARWMSKETWRNSYACGMHQQLLPCWAL